MTDEERKQAEDAIKEAYREYQWSTQGIDIWEEGAFRAGWAASLKVAEATKEMSIAFADWLDTLEPSQRVSVWSKNGEWKGLFTMDNEQLYDKWKQNIRK